MQAVANERGYVPLKVFKRKEADQYGNTHYVVEDDYFKNKEGAPAE